MTNETNLEAGWFDDLPVLAEMTPVQMAAKLEELGETETAEQIRQTPPQEATKTFAGPSPFAWLSRPWRHASHTFGFIEPAEAGAATLPVRYAADIAPDATLKGKRIKITLDGLRVAGYPGFGVHNILFDFYAKNQVPKAVEHLHFNATYRASDQENVGVIGYPNSIGLNVSKRGRGLQVRDGEREERFR